ncbi:MAG: hypothetical protein H6918_00115 [Sphingomonadaceae bacterium]|nr:hypothetical protein [Sphingomonadaceae bacterium]
MAHVPPPPVPRLCLGVTGHRDTHPLLAGKRPQVEQVFNEICDRITAAIANEAQTLGDVAPVRLHGVLADGTDRLAAEAGAARNWDLVAPLPCGRDFYTAIASLPADGADVRALLAGKDAQAPDVQQRAAALRAWLGRVRLFELAECDAKLSPFLLATVDDPDNAEAARQFEWHLSERVAMAGRVMIEQSDFLIAVWDGALRNLPGGTGHTINEALHQGAAVVRIDPADPGNWHILHAPEELHANPSTEGREDALAALVRTALRPGEGGALRAGATALGNEAWHPRSHPLANAYRRVEVLFDGEGRPFRSLKEEYEAPEAIANGSAAATMQAIRDLPRLEADFATRVDQAALRRFAWADGISTWLSDAYRGGMIANFVLSALAITAGLAYQPLGLGKWPFALAEFLLLSTIVTITALGVKRRWHTRWFATRRVAEYLRHSPILQALGVARPAGRWPQGIKTSWPEYYARAGWREVGLPEVAVTPDYLRSALSDLLARHVQDQRDYHRNKSRRLHRIHHRLDKISEWLFILAVLSVSAYLLVELGAALGWLAADLPYLIAKPATFLGVAFPTFGAALAGMRYFGDFERFASISQMTAEKLDGIDQRITLLLSAENNCLTYGEASELAHAADAVVVSEIESWQSVFGGKHITVPV